MSNSVVKQPTFSPTGAEAAADAIRSINHRLRQRIIEFIEAEPEKVGEKWDKIEQNPTVTEIYTKLGIEQSVASQHLKIMRLEGVVKEKRNGKFFNYSVDKVRAKQINSAIAELTRKA